MNSWKTAAHTIWAILFASLFIIHSHKSVTKLKVSSLLGCEGTKRTHQPETQRILSSNHLVLTRSMGRVLQEEFASFVTSAFCRTQRERGVNSKRRKTNSKRSAHPPQNMMKAGTKSKLRQTQIGQIGLCFLAKTNTSARHHPVMWTQNLGTMCEQSTKHVFATLPVLHSKSWPDDQI